MIPSLPFMFMDTCSVIDIDNFTFVNVKSTSDEIEYIKERHVSVGNPINQSLKHWLQLNFDGDIPDTSIYTWVQRAFEIVRDKYTKPTTHKKMFQTQIIKNNYTSSNLPVLPEEYILPGMYGTSSSPTPAAATMAWVNAPLSLP